EASRTGTQAYSSLAVTSEFQIGMTTEFPIPTGEFPVAVTAEFPVPAADAWTAPAPAGPGLLVRVRLIAGTPLKGVRAFLVVEAAKKLGTVNAVSPAIEQLQADEFENDFALRLTSDLTDDDVVAALRRAGDVDEVRAGEDAATHTAVQQAAPTNGNGASAAAPANG